MKVVRRGPNTTGRAFTVSGMGADDAKRFESIGVGLSYSSTLAIRAAKAGVEESSWYIRNEDGDVEARVTLAADGVIYLQGHSIRA